MVMTGHSLGRNKLEHLLASGALTHHSPHPTPEALGARLRHSSPPPCTQGA